MSTPIIILDIRLLTLIHQKRNESSDVWSLGCVFLEMTTVLNNRTIEEMMDYYITHGTEGTCVRTNAKATKLWMEELQTKSKSSDDTEPLKLIAWMTERFAKDRPDAQQVVNTILSFESQQPFYGICCSVDDNSTQTFHQGFGRAPADNGDEKSVAETESNTGAHESFAPLATISEETLIGSSSLASSENVSVVQLDSNLKAPGGVSPVPLQDQSLGPFHTLPQRCQTMAEEGQVFSKGETGGHSPS